MGLLESISFMLRLYQFLNLTQCQLEKKSGTVHRNRFLELYTVFMIIFSIAYLLIGLFAVEGFSELYSNNIGQRVDFMQLVGIRVAQILSILETLMRRYDQRKFFNKVSEVDRYFEHTLNLNIDSGGFRRKILQRGAIMLIINIGSQLFVVITNLTVTKQPFSVFTIFYFWPYMVCTVRYFQVFIGITIIKERLEMLIAALEQIDLCQCNSKFVNFKSVLNCFKLKMQSFLMIELNEQKNRQFDMESPQLKNLLNIRHLYNQLWELTNIINRCIGISLLVNIGNDFISITSNCYWIFVNFTSANTDYMTIVATAVWSIPHICNVLILGVLCNKTIQCTTSLALRLHRIKSNSFNENHNTVIEQFSLQLIHQKIAFTAAGFLKVDSKLLYTIIGAITTYLIILIQFHLSEQQLALSYLLTIYLVQ